MLKSQSSILKFERGQCEKITFSNGAVGYHYKTPHKKKCYFNLYFVGGARLENPKNEGLAHLVEHLVFKGPHINSPNNFVKELEEVGVELNAYTSKEYIQFEFSFHREFFTTIASKILKLIFELDICMDSVKKELRVIQQEITEDLLDFELLAQERIYQKAFDFSLGHSIGGNLKNLNSIGLKDINSFYKKCISPERLIFSVGGDFQKSIVKDVIHQYFLETKKVKQASKIRLKSKISFSPIKNFHSKVNKKIDNVYYIVAFGGVPIGGKEAAALSILEVILGDGMSSLLFSKLRSELSYVYGVSCDSTSFSDCGIFEISLSCQKNELSKVKKELFKILKNFNENIELHDLVNKAKVNIIRDWDMSFDDTDEVLEHLVYCEMHKNKTYSFSSLKEKIKSCDINDIKKLMKKMLKNGHSEVIVS